MKKVFLGLAIVAVFAACDQNEDILTTPVSDTDFSVTTKSVVTTEVQLDDAVEAAELEVDLMTGSDAIIADMQSVSTKSASMAENNRYKNRYKNGNGPEVTFKHNNGTWPLELTIDYGDSTTLVNGRVMSGMINIVLSGPRYMDGTADTITFENYTVDSLVISGTIIKTYNRDEYQVSIVRDITITMPDGTVVERDAMSTRTWVDGYDTPYDYFDDVFEISGYVNVADSDGNSYRRAITSPLTKLATCRYLVSGEITLTVNGITFAVIDYGDGECDNLATMTTLTGTEEFEIGSHIREKKDGKN